MSESGNPALESSLCYESSETTSHVRTGGLSGGRSCSRASYVVLNKMKILVVSGARSHVGKTSLARALCRMLPGAVRIKIGHHPRKAGYDDGFFYPKGTGFKVIASEHDTAEFLIIESNSILEEVSPDCTIYLPADNPKPSAEMALKKADIIRGHPVSLSGIAMLAQRLGCKEAVIEKIIEVSGAHKEQG